MSSYTVVVVFFQMHDARRILEVDKVLAVSPALYHDVARLGIERKQSSVQMTRRFHHSTEPPSHSACMVYVHAEEVEVVLREEPVCAITHMTKAVIRAAQLVASEGIGHL